MIPQKKITSFLKLDSTNNFKITLKGEKVSGYTCGVKETAKCIYMWLEKYISKVTKKKLNVLFIQHITWNFHHSLSHSLYLLRKILSCYSFRWAAQVVSLIFLSFFRVYSLPALTLEIKMITERKFGREEKFSLSVLQRNQDREVAQKIAYLCIYALLFTFLRWPECGNELDYKCWSKLKEVDLLVEQALKKVQITELFWIKKLRKAQKLKKAQKLILNWISLFCF